MTAHIPGLSLSLDPLMAEAKRRARQRRVLVALGVTALVGLAAGLTLALRSPGGGSNGGLATAKYPQGGVSFRYPSGLTSVALCGSFGMRRPKGAVGAIAFVTSGRANTSYCHSAIPPHWPPWVGLGTNGVSIVVARVEKWPGGYRAKWHGRLAAWPPAYSSSPASHFRFGCPAGGRHETRSVAIRNGDRPEVARAGLPPSPEVFTVDAVICGPNFAVGNAAVNRILASIHFKG